MRKGKIFTDIMNQPQPRRKRGVILTTQGWKRLQKAQEGVHYTIEALSDRTNLDPSTVSKVLHREVGVDKRTLERFFAAFDLELHKTDYLRSCTLRVNRKYIN